MLLWTYSRWCDIDIDFCAELLSDCNVEVQIGHLFFIIFLEN